MWRRSLETGSDRVLPDLDDGGRTPAHEILHFSIAFLAHVVGQGLHEQFA